MAVNQVTPLFAYGIGDNLIQLAPNPIVAQRAPTTRDKAQIGTFWVDRPNDAVYCLTNITAGGSTWTTSPASGVGVFTSVTVNPGDVDVTAGDININAGNLAIAAGNATIGGDLTVGGTTTINGDFDLTSAALIDLTSTLDAAPSIYLHANGGTSEQILIHSDQGTAVNSVALDSDVGGITLVSGLASADAINLEATAGGIDMDAALQINIAGSQNAASAIVINASAGGIDITAAGAATEDIDIVNTAGSINLNSGEVIADSMVFTSAGGLDFAVAGTGGLDIDMVNTAGAVNISSAQAAADAIVLNASDAAGGVQVQAGSAGILIGNQADCAVIDVGDVVPTSSRLITIGGGAVATAIADTIDIGPDGATTDAGASKVVNINGGALDTATLTTNIGGGNVASGTHAVNISGGTGSKSVNVGNADGLTSVNIDAITFINENINVDTSINTGTSTGSVFVGSANAGTITLDSGGAISIDGATASNMTVTGAGQDLTLSSVGGSVLVESTEDAALAIRLHANGGTSETIQIHSDQGTGVGSVNLLSDVGGITIRSTGLASADAINLEAAAGGIDVDAALQINIASSQNAADAIVINASAGGIDITNTGTAGEDIDIASTGASVNISSTEDVAQAIYIRANAGTSETIQLHADQGTAVNSVYLLSDVGGITLESGLASADAINLSATAGGVDIDGALQVNIASSQNAASAIVINASAGGIDITNTGTAGEDIDIASTGASVNISSSEAIADAITLNASNAAGGITLDTGGGAIGLSSFGNVTMVPGTATSGAGVDTVVINARVFVATFTGFVTAAAGTQSFTITNSTVAEDDGVFLTVSNSGTNDAQMTLRRVDTEGGGAIVVDTVNSGAAALNGNVVITGWVII